MVKSNHIHQSFFKIFIREGHFIKPAIMLLGLPFFYLKMEAFVCLLFTLFSNEFLAVASKDKVLLKLYRITNTPIHKILLYNNLALCICINIWVIISYTLFAALQFFVSHKPFHLNFIGILQINIMIFFSLLLGNSIAFSDIKSLKSAFLAKYLSYMLFSFGLAAGVILVSLLINTYFSISISLGFIIIFWYFNLKQYKHIPYFRFFLHDSD